MGVQPLLIGELAKTCGVTVCTLRVYERKGLIRPLYRGANGYRYYDAGLEQPIRVFGAAQSLGISLSELAAIFAGARPLQREPSPSQARAATIVAAEIYQRHIAAIDDELDHLKQVRALLEQRVTYCAEQLAGGGPVRIGVPNVRQERRFRPGRVEYVRIA